MYSQVLMTRIFGTTQDNRVHSKVEPLERLSPRPPTIRYSNGNSYMISVENSNIKRQANWNKKNTHADFDTDCCRRVVLRGCP